MALVSFDPVEGLLRLQTELDRFFGKPLFDFSLSGPNVYPLINLFTDQNGVVVRAEIPGIKPDQIRVAIEAGQVTISGERTFRADEKGSYHRRERQFGRFSRTVRLPNDLDAEHATAGCQNGVLTVRIPKAAAAKPRQIAVSAS